MTDTAVTRKLFVEMTPREQESYLEGIRDRRLIPVRRHEELLELKKKVSDQKTLDQIDKLSVQLEKAIAALDKATEKVNTYALKAQVMRISVEGEMF